MPTLDDAASRPDRVNAILSKLAETLNCPLEAFTQSVSCDLSQSIELLHLWGSIESSNEREKVLAHVRAIATHL